MMRLACVPFPAPGGPSNTTGPTSREVSCAIGLAKASRSQSPRHRGRGEAKVQQSPQEHSVETLHATSLPAALAPHARRSKLRLYGHTLPGAAAANAPAARRKSVIVAHDQLRLDLLDGVHGHADHDQQRRAAKIKSHAQTVRHKVRKSFEESPERAGKD